MNNADRIENLFKKKQNELVTMALYINENINKKVKYVPSNDVKGISNTFCNDLNKLGLKTVCTNFNNFRRKTYLLSFTFFVKLTK